MYKIKVKYWIFWRSFKAKRHWFEFTVDGQPIPPRMVIQTQDDAIVILGNITFRDWSIHGITDAIQGTRPQIRSTETGSDGGKPLLSDVSSAGGEQPQPPVSGDATRRDGGRSESSSGGIEGIGVDERA